MDLDKAQEAFHQLLDSVGECDRANFLLWIQRVWFTAECSGEGPAVAHRKLREIAQDIKSSTHLPTNAIFPSENLLLGKDCKDGNTIHVDAFLYDEMDIEDLVQEGKMSRNYCRDCNSRNISPLTFITHSASMERIVFIFRSLLPYQDGTTVLDVGSRLGAILYGAYVYTRASRIIGVEINSDFCELQRSVIKKHAMGDRIQVVCDDICNVPELVVEADVVILNNAFEFFLNEEGQRRAWHFLQNNITRKGVILITVPSLESTWKDLQMVTTLGSWVKRIPITDPLVAMTAEQQDELSEVCTYTVL